MASSHAAVRLRPRARADLAAIWAYSAAQWGTAKADDYARRIARAMQDLATAAARGAGVPHIREGYFRVLVGSHMLLYRTPGPGEIEAVRILHQRMDVGRHL